MNKDRDIIDELQVFFANNGAKSVSMATNCIELLSEMP